MSGFIDETLRILTRMSFGIAGNFMLKRLHPYTEPSGGDVIDYDEHDHWDEPDDIEYADDEPCDAPPHPWDMPDTDGPLPLSSDESCANPQDLDPKRKTVVNFLSGDPNPEYPVDTRKRRKLRVSYQDVRGKWHGKWGRHFGAKRKAKGGGERVHVGIDLFADPGDKVVSVEDGVLLATLPFYKGTGAVYILHDSGFIMAYGEVERGSWWEFGLGAKAGIRVKKGQPIARVGLADGGSHMLHVETYSGDTSLDDIRGGKMQWHASEPPPDGMLDPTNYLLQALNLRLDELVV